MIGVGLRVQPPKNRAANYIKRLIFRGKYATMKLRSRLKIMASKASQTIITQLKLLKIVQGICQSQTTSSGIIRWRGIELLITDILSVPNI